MSVSAEVESLKQHIAAFAEMPLADLKNSVTGIGEWAGLSYPEFVVRLEQLVTSLTEIGRYLPLELLPYQTIKSLIVGIDHTVASTQMFLRERSGENFYIAANSADGLLSQLITLGLTFPGNSQSRVTSLAAQIEPELSKLRSANQKVKTLEDSLRGLFTPAVSNTLSSAFSSRQRQVRVAGYAWAVLAAITGFVAIYFTFYSLAEVNQELAARFLLIQRGKEVTSTIDALLVTQIVLRSAILIPLYLLFTLCFSQYRRERSFEEEYAHKAAVAATIPSYGEIVRNEVVRDQIVSGASTVIFSSPGKEHGKVNNESNSPDTLKGISGVIESIEKIMPKR